MTPPPITVVPPVVSLAVRVLTLICIFISIIVLTTNTANVEGDYGPTKLKFKDFHAYKYLLATAVIGLVYTLVQAVLTLLQVASGNQLGGGLKVHIDFFGDKMINKIETEGVSTALATGAAVSFGMTQELRSLLDLNDVMIKFVNKANAAASLCLIAFVFCAISSTISAYSLPKRV